MMPILFFAGYYNTEDRGTIFTGNCSPRQAARILEAYANQIVVNKAVKEKLAETKKVKSNKLKKL